MLTSSLALCIILVLMKKARNQRLQLHGMAGVTHRNGMLENEPLYSSGKIIPVRDRSCTEALQYVLFFLDEDGTLTTPVGRWPKGTPFIVPPGKRSGERVAQRRAVCRFALLRHALIVAWA
jgi:hypothetical protein